MADARQTRQGSEPLLSAFIKDHARRSDGSVLRFAGRIGISRQRLVALADGFELRGEEMQTLSVELAYPVEVLTRLGQVSVAEACVRVALGEPLGGEVAVGTENSASGEAMLAEQAVRDRFVALVAERGELIPSAAYAMFITGTPEDRGVLVTLLEQHGDAIPPTTTAATLDLIVHPPDLTA